MTNAAEVMKNRIFYFFGVTNLCLYKYYRNNILREKIMTLEFSASNVLSVNYNK